MKNDESLYNSLTNKDILAILDGDTKFGNYEFEDGTKIKIAMPYLSLSDLCSLSSLFGLEVEYSQSGGNKSRWVYLSELIKHCIEEDKCSDLLTYMFRLERFQKTLNGHSVVEINDAHKKIVKTIFDEINGLLLFREHELVDINNVVVVREVSTKVTVSTPKIEAISHNYIRNMSKRALNDIEQGNYDTALTHSRTLLEEIFCHVLEKKSIIPSDSGKITDLYKQIKNTYNMHTDSKADKRINKLLSGLNSIVSAIS